MEKKHIKHLFVDELHDIFDAEQQIAKAMPKLILAVHSPDLKNAISAHLKETKGQIQRLEKAFKLLKLSKKRKCCKAAKGLVQECQDVLKTFSIKSPVRDAALIAKLQRVEHYEMSAYGTLRAFAKEIGADDVVSLLQESLDEEADADKKLNRLAEGGILKSGINRQANLLRTAKPEVHYRKAAAASKSSTPKRRVAARRASTAHSHRRARAAAR